MDKKKSMGWTIIILMVLSVFGVITGSLLGGNDENGRNEDAVEYNEFKFINTSTQWQVEIGSRWYGFQNFPSELEPLSLPLDPNKWLSQPRVYLAYNPADNFSVEQNLQLVGSVFAVNKVIPQKACLTEEGCPDVPLIDCKEKSGIIFQEGEITTFKTKDDCLILEAPDTEEMQRLSERVVYQLLGVMI